MEQTANRPRASVSFILGTATGIAAVVTGFLYTVGGVLLAGQLRPAQIHARDILPLIPLPQMLGRGLSVLLGELGVALLLVVAFGAAFLIAMVGDRAHERYKEGVAEVEKDLDDIEQSVRDTEALITPDERLDELEESVRGIHVSGEEEEKKKTDTLSDLAETRKRTAEARASLAETHDRVAKTRNEIPVPRRGMPVGRLRAVALSVNAIASLVLIAVSAPIAAPFILVAFSFYVLATLGHIRWVMGIAGYLVVYWVGFLVTGYYYPQPLPSVTLITKSEIVVKGNLLVQSDGRFYVNDAKGRYRVVSDAEIQSAYVQSNQDHRLPRFYRTVLDWL